MPKTPALIAVFALTVVLAGCSAPAGSDTEASDPVESSTPTPEALVWDGCPDDAVAKLEAGFVGDDATKVVVEGTSADITDPVVASVVPDDACVLNFSYTDYVNRWTVVVAPDDHLAVSAPLETAALAAGYEKSDYGTFITYLDLANSVGFDVTTATSGSDLVDAYQDVLGAQLFPEFEGSFVALRIEY